MKAATWFRITSGVILLLAAGHMAGFLTFRPAAAEGQAVWAAMNSVHFTEKHGTYSYGGFYVGFGLFVSVSYLLEAWLAWFLGRMASQGLTEARPIAWALCCFQLIGVGLSLKYFSGIPAAFSAAAACGLAMGAQRMRKVTVVVGNGVLLR